MCVLEYGAFLFVVPFKKTRTCFEGKGEGERVLLRNLYKHIL